MRKIFNIYSNLNIGSVERERERERELYCNYLVSVLNVIELVSVVQHHKLFTLIFLYSMGKGGGREGGGKILIKNDPSPARITCRGPRLSRLPS